MAIKQVCDGCDKTISGGGNDSVHKLGYVIQRDYCEECIPVAEKFIGELDAAHEDHAESFTKCMAAMRKSYGHKLNALPDYDPPSGESE